MAAVFSRYLRVGIDKSPEKCQSLAVALEKYRAKRNLILSGEPAGEIKDTGMHRFVVHEHHARSLHYDFRLEMNGVLRSWAVPKGFPLKPGERRLAVQVEDHPVDYLDFAGNIPPGQYGAGIVNIWDKGSYEPLKIGEDSLKFIVRGTRLRGAYALVRMQKSAKNWLLLKVKGKGEDDAK